MKSDKPYVSPWNRMDPARTKEAIAAKNTEEGKPIFHIAEGESMPLYMFIGNLAFTTPIASHGVNILLIVHHEHKTNKLNVSGRIRFDDSGNKIPLPGKIDYNLEELSEAKADIQKMYQETKRALNLTESEPPHEIEFKVNETLDNIINQLNQSNQFNIGVPEN